jgi:hypothetical protein
MIKHINEWFAFAQERGSGISREDIILVTGCHLARTWATIAFQERGEQIAFGVQMSGVSNVAWQFTPEGAQGVAYNLGPSDQVRSCIFFSASTDRDRSCMVELFLFRIRIYRRISAYSLEASVFPGFR